MAKRRMTSRKEQGLKTRQRIYETSLELFTERGYENVSIDEICDEVGVSKGAFYFHFKSKDQVILEQFKAIDELYAGAYDEVSGIESGIPKLRNMWQNSTRFISLVGIQAVKVIFHEEIKPGKEASYLASKERPNYKITELLIREAQENGIIRTDIAADELAETIITCWRGLVYDWCLSNGRLDLERNGDRLFDVIIEGAIADRNIKD
jgi:AcrR family transcriptional regulator